MDSPTYCTSCGHELGVGRFCINCGRPVPGRHPEADPTSGMPAGATATTAMVPPPSGQPPPSARYQLYAEAQDTVIRPAGPMPPVHDDRPRRRWLPWVATVVVLAVIAGLGTFLLLSSGDDKATEDRASDDRTSGQDPVPTDAPTAGSSPDGEPTQPDSSGTGGPVEMPNPDDVVDLTADVTAEVPAVAPPSRDRQNRPVRFRPANMWDGQPRTTWRMPGDGTGQSLTFDLGQDVVITEVGLINGYAKIDGPTNWYTANRRLRAVQWEFDDGTRITQELAERQTLQRAGLGPVATRTITLHLVGVTAPAPGPDGRDFTAISEVLFLGVPAT